MSSDYDSKKNRGQIVNLIAEGDQKTGYRSVRRCEGLSLFSNLTAGIPRSNLLVNDNYIYFVAGSSLCRVNYLGTEEILGTINGSGRAKLVANAVPGDSQILVLNGTGSGYIYTRGGGLSLITDVDFFSSTSATILNERFWLSRDGTNEFFASDVSDGTSYNSLSFASAEESPDNVVRVIAKKSALWVLGTDTTEYWQTYTDVTVPLRQVKGVTKQWGILAPDSLADTNDYFAFLASDRTVRMMQGTELVKISDLDFDLKIKGDGTPTSPGLSKVTDAIGFFVDGPVHSTYYITFPSDGYTWGYDINTGLSHTRSSEGYGKWRINAAVKYNDVIICADSVSAKLWTLSPAHNTEGNLLMRAKLVTPTISFEQNATIPLIEIDMEVAQTTDPTADPKMMIYYTKDGGNTYINKGTISLGKFGEHRKRIPLRRFGRVVKNKDFGLKLEITDDVGVKFYGAYIYPRIGM